MAGHGGLYSTTKLRQIEARALLFLLLYCKGERERGIVVGWYAR